MQLKRSRTRVFWIVVMSVISTLVVVTLATSLRKSERAVTRLLEHRVTVADPQFRREMSVLLGPTITGGNNVSALQNGAEIFPSMLDAIRAATLSITFETYIYWSGTVGAEFTEALSERARAGVPVHVTIDWAGSVKMDSGSVDRMRAAGVEVQQYRPLHWYNIGRFNNRTHRKLLVVDGRVAFTGGVGVADQWKGQAADSSQWRDIHFRVEGPAVAQFQAAFNDNWIKTTGTVLRGPAYFPEIQPAGDVNAQLFIASPAGGSESMHLMYLMAISAAGSTIDLAAAYFVPDDLLIDAFISARKRDVRVRILVPGPHLDSESVRIASMGEWGPLLQAGVEIHVYQPTMMHSKMLIVDSALVSVGSTNFDLRSFRLNDEASLNVFDSTFAALMTAVFEADLTFASPFSHQMWKDRPLRTKIAEKLILPIKSQL